MATQFELVINTPDTAIAGSDLNALANGSYALGPAIDNSSGAWTEADLWIALSATITAGSGSPALIAYLLASFDGTNYPTTNGSTTAGVTDATKAVGSIILPTSTVFQYGTIPIPRLPVAKFKIQLLNASGAALPSGTSNVCQVYRSRMQAV